MPENLLLEQCLKENRLAQEELFKRYGTAMMGLCSRYVRTQEDAKDLLQDGFIKVFTKLHTFKGDSSLYTWMGRIFVNTALSNLKKGVNKYIHLDIDETEEVIENLSTDDEVEINSATMLAEVSPEDALRLVQMLPDKYRTIINLYCVEEYSHKEISEMLQISEGTSKSQLSRARKMLQSMLSKKNSRIKFEDA